MDLVFLQAHHRPCALRRKKSFSHLPKFSHKKHVPLVGYHISTNDQTKTAFAKAWGLPGIERREQSKKNKNKNFELPYHKMRRGPHKAMFRNGSHSITLPTLHFYRDFWCGVVKTQSNMYGTACIIYIYLM
ncbi:hypothetical protein K440DRAFT_104658 [Wilcoxina mikolae CBS 423.85]|nr:hypothetical protein K440DRAFT_104658 [Wilcoxina mikolae CBS 423.85]